MLNGIKCQIALVLFVVILCAGCTKHARRLETMRTSFQSGDLLSARDAIDESTDENADDEAFLLDRAIVELFSGDAQAAESMLLTVRQRFDEHDQVDPIEQAAKWLSDDTAVSYAGEDYEKIMVRVMLALANLAGDGADAMAYAHQIAEEEMRLNRVNAVETSAVDQQIQTASETARPEKNPDVDAQNEVDTAKDSSPLPSTSQLAISPYLRAILREQSHREYAEAARLYTVAAHYAPDMPQLRHDLVRARTGRHSQRGNGVLYTVMFVGRGPEKVESVHEASSEALLIADRILSAIGDHTLPPTIAPVKIPTVVRHSNDVDLVRIGLPDGSLTSTETLMDVGAVAQRTSKDALNRTLARAVVRRVLKKGTVYKARQMIGSQSELVDLALNIGGVLWEASEDADTRCWALLPDQIQIARIELPVGTHRISLQPWHHALGTGEEHFATVEIRDGANTWLMANFPGPQLAGEMVGAVDQQR